jgi:hypothetical protein
MGSSVWFCLVLKLFLFEHQSGEKRKKEISVAKAAVIF